MPGTTPVPSSVPGRITLPAGVTKPLIITSANWSTQTTNKPIGQPSVTNLQVCTGCEDGKTVPFILKTQPQSKPAATISSVNPIAPTSGSGAVNNSAIPQNKPIGNGRIIQNMLISKNQQPAQNGQNGQNSSNGKIVQNQDKQTSPNPQIPPNVQNKQTSPNVHNKSTPSDTQNKQIPPNTQNPQTGQYKEKNVRQFNGDVEEFFLDGRWSSGSGKDSFDDVRDLNLGINKQKKDGENRGLKKSLSFSGTSSYTEYEYIKRKGPHGEMKSKKKTSKGTKKDKKKKKKSSSSETWWPSKLSEKPAGYNKYQHRNKKH
jgi:hypothetical protein